MKDYADCFYKLTGYSSKRRGIIFKNYFDTERPKFVESLMSDFKTIDSLFKKGSSEKLKNLIESTKKKIETVLKDESKFQGKILRPLLKDCLLLLYSYPFNYENINEKKFVFENDIFCTKQGSYLVIGNFSSETEDEHQADNLGWKFHLSFDDRTPKNIAKGWEVLLKNLFELPMIHMKVSVKNKKLTGPSEGKQITIYAFSYKYSPEDWKAILSKIEVDLMKFDVKPGKQPPHTKKILGSQYITYRNDKDANGKYCRDKFNEANEPDGFKNINLQPQETYVFNK